MKSSKIIKTLLIAFIIYFVFPVFSKALVVNNHLMWHDTTTGHRDDLNLKNVDYKTNNWKATSSIYRNTKYLGGFTVKSSKNSDDTSRVFCIQPGQEYKAGNEYTTEYKSVSKTAAKNQMKNSTHASKEWTLTDEKIENIKKVNSCYYTLKNVGESKKNNHYASVLAAQAIIWELVTNERTNFDSIEPDKLLSKTYSLYSRINSAKFENGKTATIVKTEYEAIVKCAKRFEYKPTAAKNKQSLKYKNNQFIYEFTPNAEGKLIDTSLKYYDIYLDGNKINDCKSDKGSTKNGITCKCDNKKCTFTSKEGNKNINVTFTYAYKANGKALNNPTEAYYSGTSEGKTLQLLMKGSTSSDFVLKLSTGAIPKYSIRFEKRDRNTINDKKGNLVAGAKFTLYKNDQKTVIAKDITSKNGVYEYNDISTPSETDKPYYLLETTTPANLVKYDSFIPITVTSTNTKDDPAKPTNLTTKDNKVWVNNGIIYNDGLILRMEKRSFKNGQPVETKDACVVRTCQNEADDEEYENGPIFEITKLNEKTNKYEKVCVKKYETDTVAAKDVYEFSSLKEECDEGTETSKIKTCNGKFDINNMPTGTYIITEKMGSCDVPIEEERSVTKTIEANTPVTPVTFDNGLYGIVFHKLNESGSLISGGTFALQKKENGIYKDIGLRSDGGVSYTYDKDADPVPFETFDGIVNIKNLPVGEYRFVEKEAPEGYSFIKDKDSTAIFKVSDNSEKNAQTVELVNRKEKAEGSYDSAELIVTIITGRKVVNYVFIIIGLGVLLGALIYLRKRIKK